MQYSPLFITRINQSIGLLIAHLHYINIVFFSSNCAYTVKRSNAAHLLVYIQVHIYIY